LGGKPGPTEFIRTISGSTKSNLGADRARWTLIPREGANCRVRINPMKNTPNTSVKLQKRPNDGSEEKRVLNDLKPPNCRLKGFPWRPALAHAISRSAERDVSGKCKVRGCGPVSVRRSAFVAQSFFSSSCAKAVRNRRNTPTTRRNSAKSATPGNKISSPQK